MKNILGIKAFDNSVPGRTMTKDEILARTKDIASMVSYWDKTDAIVEGYDAIKKGGTDYLPQFYDENKEDYNTRLGLAKFTNIYRDVLEGLATKPFEEEVSLLKDDKGKIEAPQPIQDFCENVDGSGNNLTMYGAATFFNGINSALDWIFIDYPTTDTSAVLTVADAKAANIRPFWSHVLARNVLEVKSQIIGGVEVLSYMRILEPGNGTPDKVRIFKRDKDTKIVTWELWRPNEKKLDEFLLEQEGMLTIDVIPLVPFVTGRRDGKTWKFFPVMRDAADLQISLYQDESALQFIKTMAGYPMLAANGMKPAMESDGKTPKKLAVGPSKVLYGVPDAAGNHGQWTYIEPSAQSMTFLQSSIKETKNDLRELGRQPLTAQSGQLTVITTAVAAGKARSAVSAWALALKNALENALNITAMWMKIDYQAQVNVYTEFDDITESRNDLQELGNARGRNDLSQETYWEELKRRKVLSPEFDPDVEKLRLLESIPSGNGLDTTVDPKTGMPVKITTPIKPAGGKAGL